MSKRLFQSLIAIGIAAAGFTGCSSDSTPSGAVDGGGDAASSQDAATDTTPADGGADASTACTIAAFAGCTTFDDRTAANADRKVTFKDFEYTPKCLRIKAGQTVTFDGDFVHHPLVTSCGPSVTLMDKRTGTGPAPFVLGTAGFYGYYCLDHGNAAGAVMAGAIDVVP